MSDEKSSPAIPLSRSSEKAEPALECVELIALTIGENNGVAGE
jgi:hypothetical protein